MNAPKRRDIGPAANFILLSVGTLFFLESARELIGTIYNFNLSNMELGPTAALLLAFFSPVIFIPRFISGPRRIVAVSAVIMALSRPILSLNVPAPLYMASAGLVVLAAGAFFTALISSADRGSFPMGAGTAVVFGAGLDVAARALGGTYDVLIYGFDGGRGLSLFAVLPLGIMFALSAFRFGASGEKEKNGETFHAKGLVNPLSGIGLGGLLFLYMNFVGYPNVVARWSEGDPVEFVGAAGASLLFFLALGYLGIFDHPMVRRKIVVACNMFVIVSFFVFAQFAPFEAGVFFLGLSAGPMAFLVDAHIAGLLPDGVSETPWSMAEDRTRYVGVALAATGGVFIVLTFAMVLSLTWAHVSFAANLKGASGTIVVAGAVLAAFPLGAGSKGTHNARDGSGPPYAADRGRGAVVLVAFLIIVAAALGGNLAARPAPGPTPEGGELVVMTYNVHQGYGMDGQLDPWDILEPIQRMDPDILFLQESDCNRISSMNTDLVGWLAGRLGMHSYFGPPTGEQIYGVATLSKYPLLNNSVIRLRSLEDPRVAVRSRVRVNGTDVVLYNIHMGLSDADRENQTAEMLSLLSNESRPVILGGDFNSWPDSDYMKDFTSPLDDSWEALGRDPDSAIVHSFDSPDPHERIDYILVSRDLAPGVKDSGVMRGYLGSDHLPVWAMMRV